ncbi:MULTISPECIES: ArnT family glycosyltransferase [Tepidiphilus]|uniref:Glycosyltransferase RgtA/B/C/D-like domain-containing protein n=1 Tax=Tepidiphilus baoligensis TaxID=2698687 RepID=A0ABX1QMI6_9PROT|nr:MULTISPECIES: hypothetical protein [Tepidiphilus]NMH17167.1 hypothetical protein [Tepidiphilus baoligensis]
MRLLLQRLLTPRSLSLLLWLVFAWYVFDGYDRHAPSNDEWVQHIYGELLVAYYRSGLADKTFLDFSNLYLYGGLFDLPAAWITMAFGIDWWPLRHLLTAAFGALAFLGAARFGRFLGGAWLGTAALAATMGSGVFSGAIFTHTKDVPFAAAMLWSLYYTSRIADEIPVPRWRHVLLWGLATGAAIGLRVGGVLAFGFLGAALLLAWWPRRRLLPSWPRLFTALLVRLVPGIALALALMAFFWPWSVMSWDHVWQALTKFSHFAFDLYTWEDGERVENAKVSRLYLPKYLLVRLPEFVLLGTVLALAHGRRIKESPRLWPLLFALAFVLAYVIIGRPPLYNGLRHFLFLVPWFALLACWGWQSTLAALHRPLTEISLRRRHGALLLAALLVLSAADDLVTLARLHPYQHLYYNHLARGLAGAKHRWEMDYWSDATRALLPVLADWVAKQPPGKDWALAYCAEGFQIEPWLPPNVHITEAWDDAELFLATTHDDCDQAMLGKEIAHIERLGTPLAVLELIDHEAADP